MAGAAIRTTQINLPPGVIDFGIGQPDFNLLPLDIMQEAAAHRFAQRDPYLLNYGYEQGDGYCRLALAAFLASHYGGPVDADDLFLCAGASQGLDLLCTLFTQPGDVIFVEEPTYFLALRIFADHRLKVIGLPTDEQGLAVDALEAQLARVRPRFLYTIPTFQNPSGATLPSDRRQRLVELSQAYEFLLVADEVYHLLDYTVAPPAPLALHAQAAPILSLGSFSKILAPGLRLGWIQGAPDRVQQLAASGLADSGGGLNHFTSALVRSVLELDLLNPYLTTLKATYHARAAALYAALQEHLPELQVAPAAGGFFLWARLPDGVDAGELRTVAEKHHVLFQPGFRFSSSEGLSSYLRLSFSFHDIPELSEGVKRLRRALDA